MMQLSIIHNIHVWLLGSIDHGNIGDHLIQTAICEFIQDISSKIIIHDITIEQYFIKKSFLIDKIKDDDILLFCGGGNLGILWPKLEKIRRDAFATWPDNMKVVFPQSVYFNDNAEEIEKSKQAYNNSNCLLCLRDQKSFDNAELLFNCEKILLPDMALYLDVRKNNHERNCILLLLRNDKESNFHDEEKKSLIDSLQGFDNSIIIDDTVVSYNVCNNDRKFEVQKLIDKVSSAKLVVTDRLHGMITSAICGTPCIVLSNSYHKIDSFKPWVEDLSYIHFAKKPDEVEIIINSIDFSKENTYPLSDKRNLFNELREKLIDLLMNYDKSTISENENSLVSVIVPVYNVEEYLSECLDSIINQTFKNTEIICVNDGSTDRSPEILNEYAKKDSRIIIINQDNKGLSNARNTGIAAASGKYIYFCDSDDYISLNTLENSVRTMDEMRLDMLFFNAIAFSDDNSLNKILNKKSIYYSRNNQYSDIYSGKEILLLLEKNDDLQLPVWQYMYRTDLIKENNIRFIEGIYHEDNSFTIESLSTAKRVSQIPLEFYHRRIHTNSISTIDPSFKHVYGYFKSGIKLYQWLRQNETDQDFIEEQIKWINNNPFANARKIFNKLSDQEKTKYLELSESEWIEFRLVMFEIDSLDKKIKGQKNKINKIEKQNKEYLQQVSDLKKENSIINSRLQNIINSKLYKILSQIRKIKNVYKK